MTSFPTIEKILQADPEVKLYALNGLATAFASTIEDSMFWCFVAATGKPTAAAADEFFRHVRFGWKRPLVDGAVHEKLAGSAADDQWAGLDRRLQELLGQDENNRNLVSHNSVSLDVYVVAPLSLSMKGRQIVTVPKVSQSRIQVKRGKRADREVGVSDMADYCSELIQLALDMEAFLAEALRYPHSHPERCAHR